MILHQNHSFFSYFKTFEIQYFHIKITTFDSFASVYDNRTSTDTWNLPKVVSETCNSLIKKVWSIQIFLIFKKGKTLKRVIYEPKSSCSCLLLQTLLKSSWYLRKILK